MKIIITILLVLAAVIILLLVLGLFLKKQHYVRRNIQINAPLIKVFDFLKYIKNQEKFNKYVKANPDRIEEFKGIDGTKGFIYSWSGNKETGQGEKEILEIIDGKRIVTEIRFIKPMRVTAQVIYDTEEISSHQTNVSITNTGILPYPINVMIPVFEKNFAKDLDETLMNLKTLLENQI